MVDAMPGETKPDTTKLDETNAAIRATGLRRTVPRRMVAEVLRRHPGHHSVGEIQDMVARDPAAVGIARSSVYRALESLERVGLVVAVRGGQEETQFEWAGQQDTHHHTVCETCGGMNAVALETVDALERELRERFGFEAKVRHLAVRGQCAACSDGPQDAEGTKREAIE